MTGSRKEEERERQRAGRRNDRAVGGGMTGRRDMDSQGGGTGIHRAEGLGFTRSRD
jgi:hypothetical protein